MTTYNHTHPGSSLPYSRPQVRSSRGGARVWKQSLAILAVAVIVCALAVAVVAMVGTTSTSTPVTFHHPGAHGRANVLFQQRLSGPETVPAVGAARTVGVPAAATGASATRPVTVVTGGRTVARVQPIAAVL
jgi:hypothetical protein